MMIKARFVAVGAVLGVLGTLWSFGAPLCAAQSMPTPDTLRFRLVGDEPIASPDGRCTVSAWKVFVLHDQKSDQCYVMFVVGSGMSATGPSVCP